MVVFAKGIRGEGVECIRETAAGILHEGQLLQRTLAFLGRLGLGGGELRSGLLVGLAQLGQFAGQFRDAGRLLLRGRESARGFTRGIRQFQSVPRAEIECGRGQGGQRAGGKGQQVEREIGH